MFNNKNEKNSKTKRKNAEKRKEEKPGRTKKKKKSVIYILKNCMHKAGKVIFRITNGSAFFVLETFTPNVNGFIWTLKTVTLREETRDGRVTFTLQPGESQSRSFNVLV